MTFLVQRLIGLCYMVVILFIRRHVIHIVRYARVHRIGLVDTTIRCLYKTVLVNTGIARQRVNQADVRTFRSLDRAHTTIMRIVNVADLKTCTVTGQTARTESGQTSLVCQLGERIILIHELGQLR